MSAADPTTHHTLDDPETYQRTDPRGMVARIGELGRQLRDGWAAAVTVDLPAELADVDAIAVLGMGGSAIGGDLVRSLVAGELKLPMQVVREYDVPGYVGRRTLVIASSYSGGTEETLSAFEQALAREAKVVAVTTGGELAARAEAIDAPVLRVSYRAQPRAALGHSLVATLAVLCRLSLVDDREHDVAEAADVLDALRAELGPEVPTGTNPAKRLALTLFGRVPIIYGAGLLSEVARRWKGQVNENAKAWSYFEVLPEANHNAIVGHQFPRGLGQAAFHVVFLESERLHPRVRRRYAITREVLDRRGVAHTTIQGRGQSALAQMLSALSYGDWVSYYLALLYEADPTPVDPIDYLKMRLSETPTA